jgi:hypothetical protein
VVSPEGRVFGRPEYCHSLNLSVHNSDWTNASQESLKKQRAAPEPAVADHAKPAKPSNRASYEGEWPKPMSELLGMPLDCFVAPVDDLELVVEPTMRLVLEAIEKLGVKTKNSTNKMPPEEFYNRARGSHDRGAWFIRFLCRTK